MKTQLMSFIRWFVGVIFGLLSDSRRVRLALTVIVFCLILSAVLIPALSASASGFATGGTTH